MEPIKVSVEVKVDFSESTKGFITELVKTLANATPATATPQAKSVSAAPVPTPAPTPKPAVAAAPAPAPKPVVAAAPAPKPETQSVTIDQVRQALAAKVNDHREEIKAKLSEYGAPSVTRLDPSHYTDMLLFLNSLS